MKKYSTILSVLAMSATYAFIALKHIAVCNIDMSPELTRFLASMFTTMSIVLLAGIGPHPRFFKK